MHKHFADWYRIANIQPSGEDIPKRWAAVEAFATSLDTYKALETARLYVGTPPIKSGFKDEFATAFQQTDPAFPMQGNDLQLRILAGAVVVQYLSTQQGYLVDATALAVTTGSCPPLRGNVFLPDVWTAAQEYLAREGSAVRSPRTTSEIKHQQLTADQLLAEVRAACPKGVPAVAEALSYPLQKLSSSIEAVAQCTSDVMVEVDGMVATIREQGDILWWLFAGVSQDTGTKFRDMEMAAASVLAGKELADITGLLPGPLAAPAVIDHLLSAIAYPLPETVGFDVAVENLGRDWKTTCAGEVDGEAKGLMPIHLAFEMSVAAPAWIKAFDKASAAKIRRAKFGPVTLAMQMYQERLLVRAIKLSR